jgi:hypothetical protein
MADAYKTAADAIAQIIDNEFSAEGILARHDKLHESLGLGAAVAGVSPIRTAANQRNRAYREYQIFERAMETAQASVTGTNEVWYFYVQSIEYPDDPTGNKSRFEATVLAVGDNVAFYQR